MSDVACLATGEVCPLKFTLSERQNDYAAGIGNLCFSDAIKHGQLTGKLDSVGSDNEELHHTLDEDNCIGPRKSRLLRRQMCRAPVIEAE